MFFLLTPRLVLVPTPIAVEIAKYRDLYAYLHAQQAFCEMGFGNKWPARNWDETERRNVINAEVGKNWKLRGMGDMAVGIWQGDRASKGRVISKSSDPQAREIRVVEEEDADFVWDSQDLPIEWIGYAGVRDAITTSMPEREVGDPPLPPLQEMVEIRYGVAPAHWGRGYASEAASCIMRWAEAERGVKRFIAETEIDNQGSRTILEAKLGFKALPSNEYWKNVDEIEWEKRVD